MPRFSIVVPAYNAEETLAETLDAVLAQTFEDWECVVVDDGSKDGTRDLAESYAVRDSRFSVISQENKGTGGAYNTGVSAAQGPWVTICSSDDVLLSGHLQTMSQAIEQYPAADIFSCNGYFWWPDDSRTLVYTQPPDQLPRAWTIAELFERCFFSVGACYRREFFELVGGYKDAFGEDYDFWLRVMARGARHQYIPEALTLHRRTATQKSASRSRAYESDVRSIRGVLESGTLSASEALAAESGLELRRLLLASDEAHGPVRAYWRVRLGLAMRLRRLRTKR